MPVSYSNTDGVDQFLVPAPFANITKEYIRTGDGKKVGSTYSITLEGTILWNRGSPDSIGEFSAVSSPADEGVIAEAYIQRALINKTQAIRGLFASDGRKFAITDWADIGSFYCYPRILSVDITSNTYSRREVTSYSISLEADEVFNSGSDVTVGQEDFGLASTNIVQEDGESFADDTTTTVGTNKIYLSDAGETWSIELNEDRNKNENASRTYTITHNVSAVGKRAYGEAGLIREPWENAKMWVDARLGLDKSSSTTQGGYHTPGDLFDVEETDTQNKIVSKSLYGFDYDDYTAYNQTRQNDIEKTSGSYSVVETWLLAETVTKANTLEDFSVDISAQPGRTEVVISGTITGLEAVSTSDMSDITQKKYDAALERWNALGAPTSDPNTSLGYTGSSYTSYSDNSGLGDKYLSQFGSGSDLRVGDFIEVKGTIDGNTVYGGIHTVARIEENGSTFIANMPYNANFTTVRWRKLHDINGTYPSEICKLARKYSGVGNLHPNSVSQTVGKNPSQGTITFSVTFDDRPEQIFPGSISESVQVSDNHAVPIFASIPVPGRSKGAVLQKMNTNTTPSRTVTVDVQMPGIKLTTRTLLSKADFSDRDIDGVDDNDLSDWRSPATIADKLMVFFYDNLKTSDYAGTEGIVFLTQDQEMWDPWNGTYQRTVTWNWQEC